MRRASTEHGFKEIISVEEAQRRLLSLVGPIDRQETALLSEADNRILAEDIAAPDDVPNYRRAAMDGYAVRAEDTFGSTERNPRVLRLDERTGPGKAVRVHTGSPLPEGADSVVMIEDTQLMGDELSVFRPIALGANVGQRGEDVRKGDLVFQAGHRLRPSDIGMLKSLGIPRVRVFERPVVAVLPTGEELVDENPLPGQVVETNGLTLSLYIKRWGGIPRYEKIATDDREQVRKGLQGRMDADLIVTIGGSSVGARDVIPGVVEELGELSFHGVALRPGHPVGAGMIGDVPIIMLPGYPVACIINSFLFVRPALRKLGHVPAVADPTVKCQLERKVRSYIGLRHFVRVKLHDKDDKMFAVPTRSGGAGILSSVTRADGFLIIPEDVEGYPEGSEVQVVIWE